MVSDLAGDWPPTQNKSKNLLSQERVQRLESLSGWSWDSLTEQWEEGVEQLQSYVNQHGKARVLANYVTPDGLKLGSWVGSHVRTNAKSLLSPGRTDALSPVWVVLGPITEQWEEHSNNFSPM